jgi:hypothetical protein
VQERGGNTLELIGIDNDFLNRADMVQQLRERIDKWDYLKLKIFCTTKEIVTKLKRLPTEWEKIFASYTSDKGLITLDYSIYSEYTESSKTQNYPKNNNLMKKWANELNRAFSKEEEQMTKKHMKQCSTSLTIQEMQIKTTLRFHLTPVLMATIKNTDNKKCW